MTAEPTDELLVIRRAQAMALSEQTCANFAVPPVSYSQYLALSEEKGADRLLLIDVRSPEEMEVSMIAGSMSQAAFESLALDPQAEGSRQLTLVPYCTIGHRSGLYGAALLAKGWDKRCVFNGLGVVPFSYEADFRLVFPASRTAPAATNSAGAADSSSEAAAAATMQLHVFSSRWDVAHPADVGWGFCAWGVGGAGGGGWGAWGGGGGREGGLMCCHA